MMMTLPFFFFLGLALGVVEVLSCTRVSVSFHVTETLPVSTPPHSFSWRPSSDHLPSATSLSSVPKKLLTGLPLYISLPSASGQVPGTQLSTLLIGQLV